MRLRFLVVRTVAFTLAFLLTLPAPSFALRTEAGLESDPVRAGLEESLREETPAAPPQASVFSWPVADLNLSVRARKGLLMLGVQTVGELVQLIEEDLTGVRNLGP